MCIFCVSLSLRGGDYSGVRGVVIPVYDEARGSAVAVVRLGSVRREHRKLGFFRVKLCPVMAAEDVRLEIRQEQLSEKLWAQLCKHLRAIGGGLPVELRNVTLEFPNEPAPRLRAKCLRLDFAETQPVLAWQGVAIRAAASQLSIAQARLPVDGHSGRLEWQSGPQSLGYDIFTDRFTTNSNAVINKGIE